MIPMSNNKPTKTAPSQRKYEKIWTAISKASVAEPVQVRVHYSAAKTLIQAVLKEKSRETAIRAKLDMLRAGKLTVKRGEVQKDGYQIITFILPVDGRKI